MQLFAVGLALTAAALTSCSKPITALQVCQKLQEAGVAANCRAGKPSGLGANATEAADFDLPSVPGHGGLVLRCDTVQAYEGTVRGYDDAKVLAGPHRYGNADRKVFVQFNESATMDVGAKARAVVQGL
jgi:hypothetical protein